MEFAAIGLKGGNRMTAGTARHATLVAICAISISFSARARTEADQSVDAVKASFEAADMGVEGELDVVLNNDGAVITVIGSFDVGLNATSVKDETAAIPAVNLFISGHGAAFGAAVPVGHLALAASRLEDIGLETYVWHMYPQVDGLRVWDSEITAVFTSDGLLKSVNGPIRSSIDVLDSDESLAASAADVLAVLSSHGLAELGEDDLVPLGENAFQRLSAGDGRSWLERGVNWNSGSVEWRAFVAGGDVRIDERALAVVSIDSHDEGAYDSVSDNCSVTIPDHPRAADGRATSIATQSGTRVDPTKCHGDDWFGTCYWQLKRQNSGTSHPIARVIDINTAEMEDQQLCSSTTDPQFSSTIGSNLRQQLAFWSIAVNRIYLDQNVWAFVAPSSTANLDAYIDDTPACGMCFNDFWINIKATSTLSGQMDHWAHEYGHYVVWSYGDLSDLCNEGTDEGNAISETFASIFGMIMYKDHPAVSPEYGALSGFANGQAPAPHTNAGSILNHNIDCTLTLELHTQGRAFEQAVWEMLFDRDCTIDTCTATTNTGNTVWGEPDEDVIEHVGTALGYAHSVLGQNITFEQVRAQFRTKVLSDSGLGIANEVQAIFNHHGI